MAEHKRSFGRRVSDSVWRTLSSMRLAVILLLALAFLLLVGTLIPQLPTDPQAQAQWLTTAEERFGGLALLYKQLGLFDIYHSPGFLLLLLALVLNTLVCTWERAKDAWIATKRPPRRLSDGALRSLPDHASFADEIRSSGSRPDVLERINRALRRRLYRVRLWPEEGATYLYAERNSLARWGTVVTHVGFLLLLAGALVSVRWGWREEELLLAPGQRQEVGHGLTFQLGNEGFEVERYADGLPKDYRGQVAVWEGGRQVLRRTIRVNEPLMYQGVSFYLASYVQDRYMVLKAVHDPGFYPVILASLFLLAGLVTRFYFPWQRIWARVPETGEVLIAGITERNRADFSRQFAGLVREIGGQV
jgi:cytochrome c biogenesis protein